MQERVVFIECQGEQLLGMLAEPDAPVPRGDAAARGQRPGVVIVVGGPQYRAGSHRYFVKLARQLAEAGYPTLRFDVRGMGDSTGGQRSFVDLSQDIGAAVDAMLLAVPQLPGVVLWGLCDGASAAMLYLQQTGDRRVVGLCGLNPWVRSEVSEARTYVKHYYAARLVDPSVWLRLVRGKLSRKAVGDAARAVLKALRGSAAPQRDESFQARMARGLGSLHPGHALIMLSDNDYTAREFEDVAANSAEWTMALRTCGAEQVPLLQADHTLSSVHSQELAEGELVRWLQNLAHRAALNPG